MSSYTIPSVIEKTRSGERVADVFSRLLSERNLTIADEVARLSGG